MTTKGIYIYGIIPNFYSAEMFRSIDDLGLYVIPYQNISAIVSDRESTLLDYTDRESLGHLLVHHQKTIEALTGNGFTLIIPMRLGTILNSKKEVVRIMSNGHALIMDALKKIQFLTEIDLAVTWADFSATLQEVANHPDILTMKDELLTKTDVLSQVDQVKMGMLIQMQLKEKNSQVELNILESLSAVSIDIKNHEVMNDQMITNSAFLINRNNREKFEQIIDKVDEQYKGMLNFKLVGPLPCYSFYTIEVKELSPELVGHAKKDLGLNGETSETEIKRVYLEKARLYHPDSQNEIGNEGDFAKINKAYHTILEYAEAARQSSKDGVISLADENVKNNLILVKIKE